MKRRAFLLALSGGECGERSDPHSQVVIFRRRVSPSASPMTGSSGGIRYAAASRLNHNWLWNTGSPGQAGR
jgi:hypothetical protein